MKALLKYPLLLAFTLALAAGGATWYWLAQRAKPAAPVVAKEPGNRLHLATDAPQRAFLRIDTAELAPLPAAGPFNGRLASADDATARVFAPVNGRLLKVLVNVGDRVRKGDVLALLDAPDHAAAVADLRRAEADAAAKTQAEQRAERLLADEALSRREFESTQADAKAARAELERAKARLANLGSIGQGGDAMTLRSPLDGVIVDRQANPGTEARSDAAAPLFVVAGLAELTLLVDLPEADAQNLHPGDKVSFVTDAGAEVRNTQIERIAPAVDAVTRRVVARAKVDNKNGQLRPEMYVRVSLLAKDGAPALRVPTTALLTQGLTTAVFVEATPGELERRTVKLLRQEREMAYLADGEGIRQGDKVVVKGAMLLASELAGAE
ncbi:hypothetical protein DLREEDagrD3_13020 [Denitratisoma sp. agr-D3]